MTQPSKWQVEKHIEVLQARSQAIIATDYDHAITLANAAEVLKGWLSSGMAGAMPVDVQSLLGPEAEASTAPAKAPGRGSDGLSQPSQSNPAPQADGAQGLDGDQDQAVEVREGAVFVGRQASYRLVERLGAGKYAQVWKADMVTGESPAGAVALKVMNLGLTEQEQIQFNSEAEVLATLQKYERDHGLLVEGQSLVPAVLELRRPGRAPGFLVETLASGQPLDELTHEHGALAEADALTVTAQFCRVLEALHESARRCYLDFQPKDVFWDGQTRRITVIDWNLLSSFSAEGLATDMLAAGSLLYRALMGVSAPTAPGSRALRGLAQPREAWDRVSLGARGILTRALDARPEARYRTAAEMRQAVEDVIRLWNTSPEALLAEASHQLRPLQLPRGYASPLNASERERVQRAAVCVNMVQKQQTPSHPLSNAAATHLADLQRLTDEWMSGRGHLENGKRQLESMGYDEAAKNFRAAADEALDIQQVIEAQRWMVVAQGLRSIAANRAVGKAKDDALRAFMLLHDGKYQAAGVEFDRLAKLPGGAPFQLLCDETQFRLVWREAETLRQKPDYPAAADAYRRADHLRQQLPYASVLQESLGDPQAEAGAMDRRAEAYQAVAAVIAEIDAAFVISAEDGCRQLQQQLDLQPGHPELAALALRICRRYTEQGDYDTARRIAGLGLDYTPGHKGLLVAHQTATILAAARAAWLRADRSGLEIGVQAVARLPGGGEWVESLFDLCFKEAAMQGDYFAARALFECMPNIGNKRPNLKGQMEGIWARLVEGLRREFGRSFAGGKQRLLELLARWPGDAHAAYLGALLTRELLNEEEPGLAYDLAQAASPYAERVKAWSRLAGALAAAQQAWASKQAPAAARALAQARDVEAEIGHEDPKPGRQAQNLVRRWFDQALADRDMALARQAVEWMDAESQAGCAKQLSDVQAELNAGARAYQQACDEALQAGREALKAQRRQPTIVHPDVQPAITRLRAVLDMPGERANGSDGNRGQTCGEARTLLDDLATQLEVVEAERHKLHDSQTALIATLLPQVFPDNPGPGETSGVAAGQGVIVSPQERSKGLGKLLSACDELIKAFPDDPAAAQWRQWRERAYAEKAQHDARVAADRQGRLEALVRLPKLVWLGYIAIAVIMCAAGGLVLPWLASATFNRGIQGVAVASTRTLGSTSTMVSTHTQVPAQAIAEAATQAPATVSPIPRTAEQPKAAPTQTSIPSTMTPVPTSTPAMAASSQAITTAWGVSFPLADQVLATYPWETVITSAVPLTLSLELHAVTPLQEPINLTLGGAQHAMTQTLLLTTAMGTLVDGAYAYHWTRAVDDLRELPDGAYRMVVRTEDGPLIAAMPLTVTINRALAVTATVSTPNGVRQRLQPSQEAPVAGDGIPNGTLVSVLGKLTQPNGEAWCYFEITRWGATGGGGNGTRRWTVCQYLSLTAKQMEQLASIAP